MKLQNPNCKNPVHINCLKNLDPRKNSTCKMCTAKYKINEGSDSRLFFPFDDFYDVPLLDNLPIQKINNPIYKIKYAIGYNQPARLKNLFETLNKTDIEKFFKSNTYYWIKHGCASLDNSHLLKNSKHLKLKCCEIMKEAEILYNAKLICKKESDAYDDDSDDDDEYN
jgi:hypothetical protein